MPGFGIAEAAGVGLDGMERPSEDVVIVLPDAVILLDGATSSRGDLPSGGDYARELGAQLAARLSAAPELDLAKLVAGSIRSVVRHNGFTPGDSPSSTVSIVRWNDTAVEALVLADSPVAAFLTDAVEVVADDRLRALRKSVDTVVEWRNREGGFWVAEALPAAADQAMRASWPRADVRSVLMATDGVSCGIDDFGVFGGWADMRRMAETDGPQAVLDAVRAAELTDPDMARWPRTKLHDDQALVHLDFAGEANGTLRSG